MPGALPDCLIILLSGLGSGTKDEIQQQLSVGVGTLVGSTVMLLTFPWAVGVYLGRRDINPHGYDWQGIPDENRCHREEANPQKAKENKKIGDMADDYTGAAKFNGRLLNEDITSCSNSTHFWYNTGVTTEDEYAFF